MRKLWVLAPLVTCLSWGQAEDTPALQSARTHMRALSLDVAKSHHFSSAEKHFVMEQLESAYPLNRSFAMLVLEGAVNAKAFPRGDYLAILEKKAKQAIGPASVTYLQAYAAVLKLGSPEDSVKKGVRQILLKRKDPGGLDDQERVFIAHVLRDKRQGNRVAGALLLFMKSDVDKGSRNWAKAQLANQVNQAKGDPLLFWEFATRTWLAHNGKAH